MFQDNDNRLLLGSDAALYLYFLKNCGSFFIFITIINVYSMYLYLEDIDKHEVTSWDSHEDAMYILTIMNITNSP